MNISQSYGTKASCSNLANAREPHGECGGGKVLEGQLEAVLVETQRRFKVVLDAGPEEVRHGPGWLVPQLLLIIIIIVF